jgi:Spy/CpxP family protein refolding chaperone
MNHTLTRLAATAAIFSAALVAQPQSIHVQGGHGGGDGNFSSTATTDPATLAARQVGLLTKLLTLTTGQQTQAITIFTAGITNTAALRTQIETAETALVTAIKANNSANITTQATLIGSLQGQIVNQQAKADAAFYLLLTADQKTKLDSLNDDGFLDLHLPGGPH